MTPPPNVKEAVTRLIESECMYFDLSSVLEVHDGSSVYKCGGEGWLGSIGDRLRLIHICIDADAEDAVGVSTKLWPLSRCCCCFVNPNNFIAYRFSLDFVVACLHARLMCVATADSGRYRTPTKSSRGTLEAMTPGSGGSLKIGRRSRSKSPFRSFRWKRSTSQAIDGDGEEMDSEGIWVSRYFEAQLIIWLRSVDASLTIFRE